MKLSATVSALLISALASSSGADARNSNTNAGSRRSVQLGNGNLVKRVSLAQMQDASSSSSNMQKKVKRQPLPNAAPIAAFGSIPSMNDGNMAIVGLNKRQASFDSHNGKQGTALTSSNTVSSSTNSGNNASTSTDSTGDDAEECEEDDEDDAEDCEEDDSADADDEECDDSEDADDEECDEEDDDEEDCDETDETDSTTASSSSTIEDTAAVATANVNVNLKQSNKSNGQSSSSSSSKKSESSATSSASQSKSTESSSSSSVDGSSQTGIATWYTQNGNAGACGTVNPDSAKIIALYTSAYANGDNCGRSVVIKNLDDGTQTNAVVADMCPSCGGPQDIDLSVGAFQAIDPEYQTHGVRNIEWYFTD